MFRMVYYGLENQYCKIFEEFFEQLDDLECQDGYLQQGGKTPHMARVSMELVKSFFEDRVFQRNFGLHNPQI